MSDLLKLPPEAILLRWFNYHLNKAGSSRRVGNFGSDLQVQLHLHTVSADALHIPVLLHDQ